MARSQLQTKLLALSSQQFEQLCKMVIERAEQTWDLELTPSVATAGSMSMPSSTASSSMPDWASRPNNMTLPIRSAWAHCNGSKAHSKNKTIILGP